MKSEPGLTAAALIHHVVADLLHQQKFPYAHFPELVDLAVVMTGLGAIRSGFEFVKRADIFWDSTYWGVFPRPFLDSPTLSYAHAMAAWMRDERNPDWFAELPATLKGGIKKSLKFLNKTNDSFFTPTTANQPLLDQDQSQWLAMAMDHSVAKQIIALRHFKADDSHTHQQQKILLAKLRTANGPLLLHALSTVESLKLKDDQIVDQLSVLTESQNDEVRAKALIALTKLGAVDEQTVVTATKMIDSTAKHVIYAAMFALSSRPRVDAATLKRVDRGFLSALQTCDYAFIQLYTAAYAHWIDDPQAYFDQLLGDAQEYLEIATDSLKSARQQEVALGED